MTSSILTSFQQKLKNIISKFYTLIAYHHLLVISFTLLIFTIFTLQTIFLTAATLYFLYKFILNKISQYSNRGIISFLPLNIRTQLLNRSLFDLLCDFWFMESFNIFKTCIKPFISQIQPENAADALNQLSDHTKQKFLTKGIINILPQQYKKVVLPKTFSSNTLFSQQQQQYQKEQEQQIEFQQKNLFRRQMRRQASQCVLPQQKKLFKTWNNIQSPTDDQQSLKSKKILEKTTSLYNLKAMKRTCSDSQLNNDIDVETPLDISRQNSIISFSTKKKSMKSMASRKWDKLQFYQSIKSQLKNQGIVKTAENVIKMVKRVIQIKNFSQNIQNVSSKHMLKIVIFFWLIVLIQIKMNKHARKIIFKTVYALFGTLSVMGALSTTAFLIYQYKNQIKNDPRKKNKKIKFQKN